MGQSRLVPDSLPRIGRPLQLHDCGRCQRGRQTTSLPNWHGLQHSELGRRQRNELLRESPAGRRQAMIARVGKLDRSRAVAGVHDSGALPRSARRRLPRGFTLIELLITVSIIAIMASMILFALYGAGEAAKTAKTRALI